jgi:hypothetical protein
MAKFAIAQVQKVVFTCEDGKQFEDAAQAEAHQFGLENGAKLDAGVEAYLNKFGYKNRSRMQKSTIAREFYSFFLSWDGEAIARTVMDDEIIAVVKEGEVVSADDVEAADVEVAEVVEVATTEAVAAEVDEDLF